MSGDGPIGMFDSGLGGLSVAREVRSSMPGEDLIYIADTAYCPYGGRPLEEIRQRSFAMTQALVDRGAKLLVVACNTASGAAIDELRLHFDLPIVGLEPAIKPAAASSTTRRIAVLATPATLQTERFHRLLDNHGSGVEVIKIPCPGFVELVETGDLTGPRAFEEIRSVLGPHLNDGVDRIVLGCTHYPFLSESIAKVVGSGVEIVDSGAAVARQIHRVLSRMELHAEGKAGEFRLLTTGDPAAVSPIAVRLWGADVSVESVSS